MKHLDNNSTNPPQYSIGELLDDYTYESEFDYYDPITKKSYTGKDGKKHLEQAINQLIYTQVLELIGEIKEYDDVLYRRLRDNAKAKYIGGDSESN